MADKINPVVVQHWRNAIEQEHICSCKGCHENSINSHILQKNGILNQISEKGEIMISEVDMFHPDKFPFENRGLKKAYTFKGFCENHDSQIFKPIESSNINFDDYKSRLLFAYRVILNEKKRKENLITYWESLINDPSLNMNPLEIFDCEENMISAISDIEEIDSTICKCELDLKSTSKRFTFYTYKTSKQEVCLSSLFTHKYIHEEDKAHDIIVNYFPVDDENILIIGYENSSEENCGPYVRSLIKKEENGFFTELNKLMFRKCEMWACSKAFYNQKIVPIQDKVMETFKETAEDQDRYVEEDVSFNIFQ